MKYIKTFEENTNIILYNRYMFYDDRSIENKNEFIEYIFKGINNFEKNKISYNIYYKYYDDRIEIYVLCFPDNEEQTHNIRKSIFGFQLCTSKAIFATVERFWTKIDKEDIIQVIELRSISSKFNI